ncbi:MAG: hypothetical protein GXX96_20430 [Planctomycetaceae bacterium]|nr:hypothetical protein [Planctomycetaceae bacterium]
MPDNQHDGKLETFLKSLVDTDDKVFHHALKSTKQAIGIGATFREVDRPKAEVHTWLAWQETPGLPYGSAIRAQFFGHDSPAAVAFVQWFRRLYGLA